jgi:4-hydroxybenzoate polyprenyltransferase
MHVGAMILLVWLARLFALGPVAWVGLAVVAGLLVYEHAIVSPTDLRRMNAAFFTLNGVIAVVFFLAFAGDVLLRR